MQVLYTGAIIALLGENSDNVMLVLDTLITVTCSYKTCVASLLLSLILAVFLFNITVSLLNLSVRADVICRVIGL